MNQLRYITGVMLLGFLFGAASAHAADKVQGHLSQLTTAQVTTAGSIELSNYNASSDDKTDRGCVCVAPDGRRYRNALGQPGCPAPDSPNADYRSCK